MKTYLITTHHNRHTRYEFIREHLAHNQIEFTPIMAPDWKLFQHTTLKPEQFKHQSLTLAYYQIAQTAIFEKLPHYRVMEDDIFLTDKLLEHYPPHFDLVYETCVKQNLDADTEKYSPDWNLIIKNWWETPITVWNIIFAKAFIHHIEDKLKEKLWLGHIDHELNKLNATRRFKFYGSTKEVAVGLSTQRDLGRINFAGSISDDVA